MPPLLCLSPHLLGPSFPSSEWELASCAVAVGEIDDRRRRGEVGVLLTEMLHLFLDDFDWNRTTDAGKLEIIYRQLQRWFLEAGSKFVEVLDTSDLPHSGSHPIPEDVEPGPHTDCWAEEVAKLLVLHDENCESQRFCVGVACARAFSGQELSSYGVNQAARCFPVVGPMEVKELDDAYTWSDDGCQAAWGGVLTRELAERNAGALGANVVRKQKGGSHTEGLKFSCGYFWGISTNTKRIPNSYLKEIEEKIGIPKRQIKAALLSGVAPRRELRLKAT